MNLRLLINPGKRVKAFSFMHITTFVCFLLSKVYRNLQLYILDHNYTPFPGCNLLHMLRWWKKMKTRCCRFEFWKQFFRCQWLWEGEDKVTRCYLPLLSDKNFIFTFFIPFHFTLTPKFSLDVNKISLFFSSNGNVTEINFGLLRFVLW